MRCNLSNQSYWKFLKKFKFGVLKSTFFISSLLYFCVYFFYNIDQISFDINLEKNGFNLSLSFLFCVLSVYLTAYAWKYIVKWFGVDIKSNNLVSFYVLTNILKYVPGGIWHFVERFNFIKNKNVILTDAGVDKVEKLASKKNLLKNNNFYDPENLNLVHHVNQALRANHLFQKGKDYIVKDNNIEQALRVLKRKLQRDGFFKIIKLKNTYEKPSEKKKRILQENIKRVKKLNKLKNRI